jgi:glycosyltransferase involved in cell wall biosynthesis
MAAYNGENFIARQIDSIITQSRQDFILYINDDASTDNTFEILQQYAEKYPRKVQISQRSENSGDAKHNFIDMMISHKADYVMLCDQDDVWLPNKIEVTLNKMKAVEKLHPNTPVLIHTDLKVADQNLRILMPSYKKATNRNYNRTAFNQALTLNNVSGCTVMYNRALSNLIERKPDNFIMHDWWLQLIAAAFGKIGHTDEATILYRQHGGNSVGAKDTRTLSYKLKHLRHSDYIKERIQSTYPQAESFLKIYREKLTDAQKKLLEQFISIPKMKKINRWRTICKLGVFMDGFSRNAAYFLFV